MAVKPYQHGVWRVSMLGSMFGGAEQFSMGFYVGREDGDCPSPAQADADAIAARAKTFFITPGSNVSWAAQLTELKISNMAATGYTILSDTQFALISGAAGPNTTNGTPQDALAVTLTSDRARGVAAKGRFYLPCWRSIPTESGHVEMNDAVRIRDAAKVMLDGVNSDLAAKGLYVILASHGNALRGEAPMNKRVTGVRVGDVIDTVRRRRNGIKESYYLATLA